MASAPKKPRTGDAPAREEQPSVEEMPEVDGNPSVDEPRLEEDAISDVPPVRPPPRLRVNGCKCVQLHTAKEYERHVTEEGDHAAFVWPLPPPTRVLLVNRPFLNAFFDSEPFGVAQIFFTVGHMGVGKVGAQPVVFAVTAAGVTSLLRLARDLTEIGVHAGDNSTGGSFAVMRDWMRVVSQLRALPNLAAIGLTAALLEHADANFLVDLLPDHATRLWTDNLKIATLLQKRTAPLESAKFEIRKSEHPYIADVLRLKSSRIELTLRPLEEPPQLHPLHDCGPLERNERLQELCIRAEIFADGGIRRALSHLRALNSHFKLVCHETRKIRLKGPSDMDDVEDIAEQAKDFSVLMAQAGFGAENGELRISVEDSEKWQHVTREQVFERLGWAREGEIPWPDPQRPESSMSLPTCSLVYEGVRILIGLGSIR